MPSITFANSIGRNLNEKLGEVPSLFDFGAKGDGTTDDTAAINAAVASVVSKGGGWLFAPPADVNYKVMAQIDIPSGVTFYGAGKASLFKRGATLAATKAIFSLSGSDITLRDIAIDGNVTASIPVDLTTLGTTYGGEPMDDHLTANTSIWVRAASVNVKIVGVTVTHTGGYAIIFDARTADITSVQVLDCEFLNNRPHVFGPIGDVHYGSWTGGILLKADGTSFGVKGCKVSRCRWRRATGTCLWMHSNAFNSFHTQIEFTHNSFRDFGLDAIQPGGVIGGIVGYNSMYRGGYLHTTDIDAPVPLVNPTTYAVALDSTGYVQGVNYVGNSIVQQNGGGIDLDGFFDGVVDGNTLANAVSADPYYTLDQVGSYQPTKGIQTGNTYYARAARNVTISNNEILNYSTAAISLKNARGCKVIGNRIWHPSGAASPPIILINVPGYGITFTAWGASNDYRSFNTTIAGNHIEYGGANFCIAETLYNDGTHTYPWNNTDVNRVLDNVVVDGANFGEFLRHSTSGTVAGSRFPTNDATATAMSENLLQREGFAGTAAFKVYKNVAGAKTQLSQLSDASFLNVSVGGAAATGNVATGNRSSLAWPDCIATSKLYGDGFLGIGAATYADADANLLDINVGLIRYNATTHIFEQSTSISGTYPASTRIWAALGGSGSASIPIYAVGDGATTYTSGLIIELTAQNVLDLGLNQALFGGSAKVLTAKPGGYLRFDARGSGNPVFSLVQRKSGDGASAGTIMLSTDENGIFSLGGTKTQLDQLGNITITNQFLSGDSGAGVGASNGGVAVPYNNNSFNAIQAPIGGILGYRLTAKNDGIWMYDSGGSPANLGQVTAVYNTGQTNRNWYMLPLWVKSTTYNAIAIFDCDNAHPTAAITGWGGIEMGQLIVHPGAPLAGTPHFGVFRFNDSTLKMQVSNDNGVTWNDLSTGSVTFPISRYSGTTPVGIVTEVTDQILDMTVNDTRFLGSQILAQVGTGIRLDARGAGNPVFSLWQRDATVASSSIVWWTDHLGTLFSGASKTQIDQAGNLTTTAIILAGDAGASPGTGNGGINVPYNTNTFNSIQAPSGAVYAKQINAGLNGFQQYDPGGSPVFFPITGVYNSGLGSRNWYMFPLWVNSAAANAISIRTQNVGGTVTAWGGIETGQHIIHAGTPATAHFGVFRFNEGSLAMQLSNDDGATWNNISIASFPITRTTGTFSVGIATEVTDSLIEIGVNDSRFGSQVNASPGGFLRLDGRASANQVFSIWQRVTGGTSVSLYWYTDTNGVWWSGNNNVRVLDTGAGGSGQMTLSGTGAYMVATTSTLYNAVGATVGGVFGRQVTAGTTGLFVIDDLSIALTSFQIAGVFRPNQSNKNFYLLPFWVQSGTFNAIQIFSTTQATPDVKQAWGGIDLGTITFETFITNGNNIGANGIPGLSQPGRCNLYFDGSNLKISQNTGAYQTVLGGSALLTSNNTWTGTNLFTAPTAVSVTHEIMADQAFSVVLITAYGSGQVAALVGRSSGGTLAAPSNTASGQLLFSFGARGYASGWTPGTSASFNFVSTENWGTAGGGIAGNGNGARIDFYTTPTGFTYTSKALRFSILDNGGVVVNGTATGNSFQVLAGYMTSSEGYTTPSTSYQSFKNLSGGINVRSGRHEVYTQVGQNFGVPSATAGDSFVAGALFWNTQLAALYVYNGSSWSTVGGGGGAVTSVQAGGNGILVSPTTGNTIVSLSTVTSMVFGAVTAGVIQSTVSGATPSFQNANNNFIVWGDGSTTINNLLNVTGVITGSANMNLSGAGSTYNLRGTVILDSGGRFVGGGVDCAFGVAGTGFNIHGGSLFGQTRTVTISGNTFTFTGGILTGLTP